MTESAKPGKPPRSCPRWLVGGLFASLAINLLVIGLLVGRHPPFEFGFGGHPPPGPPGFAGFGHRIAKLPDDEREKFMTAMREYRPLVVEAREALLKAREHASDIMRHEPYDPEAMSTAFSEVRARGAVLQERMQNSAVHALAVLTPDSRRTIAKLDPPPPLPPD